MEKEKFEPTPMPEVYQCEIFENFQALADKWDAEGFRLDRNEPNNRLQSLVDSYRRDQEISDVRLSTAYTNGTPENNYKGEKLADHTCVWIKVEKKQ